MAAEWLRAIESATNSSREGSLEVLDESLSYLSRLKEILVQPDMANSRWSREPTQKPPRMDQEDLVVAAPATVPSAPIPITVTSSNPFAAFGDSDEEASPVPIPDDDEAGDAPVYEGPVMDVRRIVLRICTAQSDILTFKAIHLGKKDSKWLEGAHCYAMALDFTRYAISLADSQVSRWMSHDGLLPDERRTALMKDADIVQVTTVHLSDQRDRYLQAAKAREAALSRKLAPQWEKRDQVKARMGDRWKQNPNPTNTFANQRKADEGVLRDVRQAIEFLEANVDTSVLVASSTTMAERLESNRHNGVRPTYYGDRVSPTDYPDATMFGWTFTGSVEASKVEFFEVDVGEGVIVKMDFYYTSATVKTSMLHPKQGHTQLFGKRVTPDVYRQILEDPRAHTGVRYQRKKNNRKRPNKTKK